MHTKYQHGGDIYSNKVSIDYSANINPLGLPQGVKEELARCIEEPVCCVYPDSQCRDLVKALADYHKVTQDWILCGDGAADLIFGLAFALKPKKALLLAPSFLEYEQALKAVDCDIDLFYLKEENGYRLDVEELCKTLERANATYNTTAVGCSDQQKSTSEANNGYNILFLCNPNNPTATLIDSDELHAFQKKLPEHVLLVVDEAYIDFVEDPNYRTMVDAIADDENLIVVRTFSKLYGMAGARMGYLMANREIIEYLQRDSTGFCCSRMGLHAAEAALDDVEFQEMTKKGNQEGREILVSCMKELGFRVWPSHTNFIYFDPGVDVKWFADRLLDYGIIIRGNFKANRISIGTPEEDRFVCKAMREIMANR